VPTVARGAVRAQRKALRTLVERTVSAASDALRKKLGKAKQQIG